MDAFFLSLRRIVLTNQEVVYCKHKIVRVCDEDAILTCARNLLVEPVTHCRHKRMRQEVDVRSVCMYVV